MEKSGINDGVSPNDSKGWGEILCNSGGLTKGVVEPIEANCRKEKPERKIFGSLEGARVEDDNSVAEEESGTIQAYQLVFPFSGNGSSLTNSLEVGIPEVTVLQRQGARGVVYWVNVSIGFASWSIPRSVGEFETLHVALHSVEGIDSLCVPQFPGVCFLESSSCVMDPSVVEQCREAMHVYLQAVCIRVEMWKCKELVEFLDVRTSMLTAVLRGGWCLGPKQHHYVNSSTFKGVQITRRLSGLTKETMDTELELTDESESTTDPYRTMPPHSHHRVESMANETEISVSPLGRQSIPTCFRAPIPFSAEIDMSDLDSISKRISNFHFSSQMATGEYGGLCDKSLPPVVSNDVETQLKGPLSISPTLGECGEIAIPGGKCMFLRCLRKGSSIFGDPYDPLFHSIHSTCSQGSLTATSNAADSQHQYYYTMSEDEVSGHGHEGLNCPPAVFDANTFPSAQPAGSIASPNNSMCGDARFLTLGGSDMEPEELKGMLNVSFMFDGLPLDLVPANVKPCSIDQRVTELLRVISPTPIALEFRESVTHFISKIVSHALGVWCFAVGGFALNAYLPDEDISLCAYLCQGQEPTWCFKVNELLCKESSARACNRENVHKEDNNKGHVSSQSAPIEISEARGGGGADSSSSSPKKTDHHIHQLSYVNFINSYPFQRISCAVDNKVAINITANCLDDFVVHVLYEDVNKLLGKNHLFKQSLLLIKAWWLYESRAYTGFKLVNPMNEATLFALVFAVVNVHHKVLHTPLQVMAMFFHVYGVLSWEGVVVGPAGPVPRDTYIPYTASTYPSSMLVSYDVITQYMNFLKGGIERSGHDNMQEKQQEQFAIGSSSGGDITNKNNGDSHMGATPVEQEPKWVGIMVVVHPLKPDMNIIGEWGKTPKASKVVQIMNMSANNLKQLFRRYKYEASSQDQGTQKQQHPPSTQLESTSIGRLDAFFGLTWERFGWGWRPDVWHQNEKLSTNSDLLTDDEISPWTIPSEVLHVDLDELHRRIEYCILLLHEEVTEGGVRSLIYNILQEKGAIPVGEVGKLLQDATSLPHLSKILKEKFGGLKRFLENNSNVFYISKDHPFNPCVYIRDHTTPNHSGVENKAGKTDVCFSRHGGGIEDGGVKSNSCSGGNKNTKWKQNQKK